MLRAYVLSLPMLFLLKIAVPPFLVAAMSLAARWWGPTIGGLLLGMPWMTGPVLFFLALDKGEEFAVGACAGIELGVVCVAAFMVAYGAVSSFARWPASLAAAAAAFAASALAISDVALTLPAAAAWAAASLIVAYLLLPRPRAAAVSAKLPWWDIPARMLTAFALVAIIMLSADVLGARLSGIVSTYPAMVTVIGTFTHRQWGLDAVRHMLRGLTLSLLVFVAFFLAGRHQPADGRLGGLLRIRRGVGARHRRRPARLDAQAATRMMPRSGYPGVMAPTTAAVIMVASVPEMSVLAPRLTISARRAGTIATMPPIMMPRLPKLAKPHSA